MIQNIWYTSIITSVRACVCVLGGRALQPASKAKLSAFLSQMQILSLFSPS